MSRCPVVAGTTQPAGDESHLTMRSFGRIRDVPLAHTRISARAGCHRSAARRADIVLARGSFFAVEFPAHGWMDPFTG
jgi:hypothetical protein